MTSRTVAFGLGANLGDARGALRSAVGALRATPGVEHVMVSPLYRTAPVGGPEQPDYLNAVAVARTGLSPRDLLAVARSIEAAHDRTRDVRWGPRTLDVDILAVSGLLSDDPEVTLPHPRAHLRGFVLVPWARVDPQFDVPGHGTVAQLCQGLPDADVVHVVEVEPAGWWQETSP